MSQAVNGSRGAISSPEGSGVEPHAEANAFRQNSEQFVIYKLKGNFAGIGARQTVTQLPGRQINGQNTKC
jgi:hypothetical protein